MRTPDAQHRAANLLLALLLCWAGLVHAAELRSAPPLTATLLDGTRFSSAEQAGKVILVNFWATWCAPCREEMPAIEAFYQRYRSRGLQVIAISLDEPADLAKVREIAGTQSFPVALSAQAQYKGYGRIWRLPMTFVIDRDGKLRDDLTAKTLQVDTAFLEQRIAPLLQP